MQFVSGHEETPDAAEPYCPTTAKEHFKAIYFEIINVIYDALKKRFEQSSFIFCLTRSGSRTAATSKMERSILDVEQS